VNFFFLFSIVMRVNNNQML